MNADRQALEKIDQIGPTMAKSIYDYFQDKTNRSVIEAIKIFLKVKPERPKRIHHGKLTDKTVVVTGSLENFTRQQAEQAIRQAGGKTSSTVSKKTDFVLAGKDPGSKLDKAQQLGVKVIDEKQFLKLIGTDA